MLAEDSVLVRAGLARVLADAGFEVTGEHADGVALVRAVDRRPPDVVVVDVRMPPTFTDEGLQAAQAIRERHPTVGVLVLSQELAPRQALRLLAGSTYGVGYLLKDRIATLDEFARAVERVGRGGCAIDPDLVARLMNRNARDDALATLTTREREILALMAEGRSNQAIAAALFLGVKTIETHISSLLAKLGLAPEPDDHRRVLAVLAHLGVR